VYADTDIFIAVLKKHDRLKPAAVKIFNAAKEGKIKLSTSAATMIEILFFIYEYGIQRHGYRIVNDLFNLKVEFVGLPAEIGLEAAALMDRYGTTPLDAIHALMAGSEILSTDKVYEKMGLKRVDPVAFAGEL
jgi:predicted nucleic acid-binding protein